jgi:hypothetical protein
VTSCIHRPRHAAASGRDARVPSWARYALSPESIRISAFLGGFGIASKNLAILQANNMKIAPQPRMLLIALTLGLIAPLALLIPWPPDERAPAGADAQPTESDHSHSSREPGERSLTDPIRLVEAQAPTGSSDGDGNGRVVADDRTAQEIQLSGELTVKDGIVLCNARTIQVSDLAALSTEQSLDLLKRIGALDLQLQLEVSDKMEAQGLGQYWPAEIAESAGILSRDRLLIPEAVYSADGTLLKRGYLEAPQALSRDVIALRKLSGQIMDLPAYRLHVADQVAHYQTRLGESHPYFNVEVRPDGLQYVYKDLDGNIVGMLQFGR